MANIRSFKELRVWQNAVDSAMVIFQRTKMFPPDEVGDFDQRYEQILAQLATMIDNPDDWVVGVNRVPRVSASPRPRV